jgi:hypothetical protein
LRIPKNGNIKQMSKLRWQETLWIERS